MKSFLLLVLMSAGLITAEHATAQSVDDVIAKHIEAVGGRDAWLKVNSIRLEGNLNVQGTDVNVALVRLHNKGMRQDITVMGMTGYRIVTPNAGVSYMPFQGQTTAVSMTSDELNASLDQLDAQGVLLDYKQKGHTATLAGKETVDGAECFKIDLVLKGGKKETMYIDSKTYFVDKLVAKIKIGGQEVEQSINYSNYKKLDAGVYMPYTILQQVGQMDITKIDINAPVDESIFVVK